MNLFFTNGIITCEELLRLKLQDVAPEESGTTWIRLLRAGLTCSHLVIYELPPYLWKSLCHQIQSQPLFVFSNKYGGPLLPGQIDTHLRRAGKLAGIETVVTSLALRPLFNKKRALLRAKNSEKSALPKEQLAAFTLEEWERICKSTPSIIHRKGRKSTYHPCDILNAIVYRINTQCPIRKLPASFPPGEVVDSQFRRWKKQGVIEKIFKIYR